MKQPIEIKPGVLCWVVNAENPENNGRIVNVLAPVQHGEHMDAGDGIKLETCFPDHLNCWWVESATAAPLLLNCYRPGRKRFSITISVHKRLFGVECLKPIFGDDVDTKVDTVSTKTVTQGE